jgi:LmbE family N-acetylglucosaminyl deacetylase
MLQRDLERRSTALLMSEVELEIGVSMRSHEQVLTSVSAIARTQRSGIVTLGPHGNDLLAANLTGVTLLAVWAHPDDEAYLGAGLMSAIASSGGRVVCATASLGERGTDDASAYPPDRLGPIRLNELERSLAVIGADRPVVLGYPDGGCNQIPDRMGANRVASLIEEFRPDIVLAFGPDGVTGHPDHRAIGRWTARAVAAQDRPPALLTTSAASVWPDDIVDRMHHIGAFYPGFPDDDARADDLGLTLTGPALDTKLAALRSHSSQIGPLVSLLGDQDYTRLAAVEAYRPSNRAARTWLNPSHGARSA